MEPFRRELAVDTPQEKPEGLGLANFDNRWLGKDLKDLRFPKDCFVTHVGASPAFPLVAKQKKAF